MAFFSVFHGKFQEQMTREREREREREGEANGVGFKQQRGEWEMLTLREMRSVGIGGWEMR
jgi:hypothetical protein